MSNGRACDICRNANVSRELQVEEMMFGSRQSFTYLQCGDCGCLQLLGVPEDMGRFYPGEYYSFHDGDQEQSPAKRMARRMRASAVLRGWSWPSSLGAPAWRPWFAAGVTRDSHIIDVGCGNGARLKDLRQQGFKRLCGYDPLVPPGTAQQQGITFSSVVKDEWFGAFDVVMLHHSLEHMPEQAEALQMAVKLLRAEGEVLVRIPLSDSFAFERYGPHWVQLDAPRHLFLHTRKSLSLAAAEVGLFVKDVVYDSTGFQFWGSELYRQGVQLHGTDIRQHFPEEVLSAFERDACRLNGEDRGDQAAIRLGKVA